MTERPHLPGPVAALFPAAAEGLKTDEWLSRQLAAALGRVTQGPVMPSVDMAQFRRELAALDFATPVAVAALLDWTIRQLEVGTVHMTHPRYFGLFNPAPSAPAQWADRIAGAFNPQLASSGSSPVPSSWPCRPGFAPVRCPAGPGPRLGCWRRPWSG